MTDERSTISRREFAMLTLAAGLSTAAGADAAAEVIDTDVSVKTPDGTCDAALIHPKAGHWPGAIIFTDIFGLRPTMREMAKRLARDGYTVLVPNPFYRSTKAPGLSLDFDFSSPADRAKLDAYRAPMTPEAVMRDAAAYVAYLDAQSSVNRRAKIGVVGYCMGGPMTLQAAAANPDRIGAGASFHGGGLVTDKPDSPHLLVAKIKAQFYFGIAQSDDAKQPDAKTTLKAAFAQASLSAKVEVYEGTMHGWCPPDSHVYNPEAAEKAWGELLALFKGALG